MGVSHFPSLIIAELRREGDFFSLSPKGDLCTIVSIVIPAERSESRDPSFRGFWRRDGSRLSRFALGRDDNVNCAKVSKGERA
jgi:hypothetical protein